MAALRVRLDHFVSIVVLSLALGIAVYFHFVQPPFAAIPSTSMEPTLKVGDLARIGNISVGELRVGDIVVVKLPASIQSNYHYPASVVHRIVSIQHLSGGEVEFRTKGDANRDQDPYWVLPSEVQGKVVSIMHHAGYPVLFFQSKQGHIFLLSVAVIYVLYQLYGFFEKGKKRVRRTVSEILLGDLVERVESMESRQQLSTEKIDEALKNLSSAIENYAYHLQSHTSAVVDLAESADLIQKVTAKQLEIMKLSDQMLHRGFNPSRVSSEQTPQESHNSVDLSADHEPADRAALGFLDTNRAEQAEESREHAIDDPVEAEIERLRQISQKYRDLF